MGEFERVVDEITKEVRQWIEDNPVPWVREPNDTRFHRGLYHQLTDWANRINQLKSPNEKVAIARTMLNIPPANEYINAEFAAYWGAPHTLPVMRVYLYPPRQIETIEIQLKVD